MHSVTANMNETFLNIPGARRGPGGRRPALAPNPILSRPGGVSRGADGSPCRTVLALVLGLVLVWGLAGGRVARAHAVETIESLALTNYAGWLVAADVLNNGAGYDRDALRVNASVRFATTNATVSTVQYQTSFRLLDAQGVAVPLVTGFLQTNGVVQATNNVTLPSPVVPGVTSVVVGLSAALKPAVRLDPYAAYRVEARLAERPWGSTSNFVATGDVRLTPGFGVIHFTNLVSGDPARNVVATLNSLANQRTYAVRTVPGKRSFQVQATYSLRRYDDFDLPSTSGPVDVVFACQLLNTNTGQLVPLKQPVITLTRAVPTYVAGTVNSPGTTTYQDVLELEPADGAQLDSVHHRYQAIVGIGHVEIPGAPAEAGNTVAGGVTRLLHFSGDLRFGAVATRFESLANVPGPMGVFPDWIDTFLAVDGQKGWVVGSPGHTYGDGTLLPVRLGADGVATYTGATAVPVTGPNPDAGEAGGIRFQRLNVQLNNGGGTASFVTWYPAGFGTRSNATSLHRLLMPYAVFASQPVTGALLPAANPVQTVPAWGCEETKPFLFQFSAQTWDVPGGRFLFTPTGAIQYTRADELAALKAAPVSLSYKFKPSNDGPMQGLQQVAGNLVEVGLDPQKLGARMTVSLSAGPTVFLAHFPHQAVVTATNATTLVIEKDLFVSGASRLTEAGAVGVAYARDCTGPGCGGAAGVETLQFRAQDDELHFTRDGGLTAKGIIVQPRDLTWGWIPAENRYAHRVEALASAGFHMPGFFLRGGETGQPMANRPAVLLFTGVGTNSSTGLDFTRLERPNSAAYVNGTNGGLGDYAGLNFRVGTDAGRRADSTLAGEPTGLYDLTGRSKYYVRRSGVSGVHEAVPGTFPSTNRWYGYSFQVDNFGLAVLDSRAVDSRTEGSVHVPAPSAIDQNFEKLLFNCLGGLEQAQVPAGEKGLYQELAYWKADVSTLSMRFDRDDGLACEPGQGKLVLGVKGHASPFPGVAMFGELGFETNGNLITLKNSPVLTDVSSRLKLPANLALSGPSGETWNLEPVNDAYFNNHDHRGGGAGAQGWLNIAGKLDAPFFEDLQVHLHCGADKDDTNAPVHVAGGWEIPGKGYEWQPGRHFFNQNPADQDNAGWPKGEAATVDQYRAGDPATERWLVRARRLWLDVVPFDYPLVWNGAARSFRSARDVTDRLLVLEVEHQLKYLSPARADLVFGLQYDGVPQLNLANVAYGQLGGLKAAVDGVMGPALDAGLGQLAATLSPQGAGLFEPAIDALLRPRVQQMVQALRADYQAGPWTNLNEALPVMAAYTTNGPGALVARLRNLANDPGTGPDLAEAVQQKLGAADLALGSLSNVLARVNGGRPVVAQLLQAMIQQAAPQFVSVLDPALVQPLISRADPALDQLLVAVGGLRQGVGNARGLLDAGGAFRQELSALLAAETPGLQELATRAQGDFLGVLGAFRLGAQDSPFAHYTDAQLTDLFVQKLRDRFLGSGVASRLREVVRHRLYDLEAAARQTTDSVFQQVNIVARDLLSGAVQQLDDSIAPMLDDLRAVAGAGKVNGHAHINGDSLKELRLDAYASLKAPSDLEFHGYLIVRELDSENFPAGCLPAGGKATEVTLGADGIPVKFTGADATIAAGAKFTFDGSGGRLLGMAGGIDLDGTITLGPATIRKLSASLAFGEEENYFSAVCGVSINSYSGLGGLYFGRTCTLDPLKWDPEIQKVVGQPPFTGGYTYVEVWIPVSEALLGIPATCMFQVSAGMGMGAGFFAEGPTFLGKALLGVSGDFLCVASIYGDIKLAGKGSPQGITMLGSGTFEVELCALICISASKTVEIRYTNGSWDIDF